MQRALTVIVLLSACPIQAAEPTAAERGKKALTETVFIPAFWTSRAVENAWKQWGGIHEKPANYDTLFRERYGLHPAPYPNDGLPMGLRKTRTLLGSGIAVDCMVCHGGSILGTSYLSLGNSTLDIQALFEELARTDKNPVKLPFTFSNVRGTNEADGFGVYLMGYRNPDLSFRSKWQNLGLHDDTCADVPAWWLLKKKRTMYYTGATDARSVRSLMQFMMHPLNRAVDFHKAEPAFRDIQQYLLSLKAPRYPFTIDHTLATEGEQIFREHCARCHGTYGEKWTYPNKVIPLEKIGTDPSRHAGIEWKYGKAYSESWFAHEKAEPLKLHVTAGYQAPPLDGIWATAPYLHNGSVPTLAGMLNSKARPKRFTRSYRTDEVDYDKKQVGWKITEVNAPVDAKMPGIDRRKIYDTTLPGRSNAGHTFGDTLSDAERQAVIEYLKTL